MKKRFFLLLAGLLLALLPVFSGCAGQQAGSAAATGNAGEPALSATGLTAQQDPDTALWGYVDESSAYAIEPQYLAAAPDWYNDRAYVLQQGGAAVLIDPSGKTAKEVMTGVSSIRWLGKGAVACADGDYILTLFDAAGERLIDDRYDWLYDDYINFDTRGFILAAQSNGFEGQNLFLINPQGKALAVCAPVFVTETSDNGWLCVRLQENVLGYLDLETMEVKVQVNGVGATPFSGGYAIVHLSDESTPRRDFVLYTDEVIDESGQVVLGPVAGTIYSFRDGYAVVKTSPEEEGVIDGAGNYTIGPLFASIGPIQEDGLVYVKEYYKEGPYTREGDSGYRRVSDGAWVEG